MYQLKGNSIQVSVRNFVEFILRNTSEIFSKLLYNYIKDKKCLILIKYNIIYIKDG